MRTEIVKAVAAAAGLPEAEIAGQLTDSREPGHGDFALPCFILARAWKQSPPACAAKLAAEVALPAGVARCEASGPYLNFFLDRAAESLRLVGGLVDAGADVGRAAPRGERIVVEYSSPNIAKPFHVGHLRTTVIGHALDRIHRHLGYDVISINHLGDWGTQFGFVWAGCGIWGKPADARIGDLVGLYQRASALRKNQDAGAVAPGDADKPDVNAMARDYFIRLEAGEPEARAFWEWCLDISLDYFKTMYDRMGVRFDHYTGESFFQDSLAGVESMIRGSGILEESRGALGVDLGPKLGFVRVFAEDGRSLYITRDIAAAEYRTETYDPVRILYVVGAPQQLHFQQLIGVLERMGRPSASRIVHVPYGHVPGISTRGGAADEKVLLNDLLDDAHARAREAYSSQVVKKPQDVDEEALAEAVGLGAIFFDYLSRSNIKDFHFNWDDALNFQGDTGPYIQYALARINSIAAKAAAAGLDPAGGFDASLLAGDDTYQLVFQLRRFEGVLQKAAAEYEPYLLANYLLELARSFSARYNSLRVLEQEPAVAQARLSLFCAVGNVLRTGLGLLGVPPVERM